MASFMETVVMNVKPEILTTWLDGALIVKAPAVARVIIVLSVHETTPLVPPLGSPLPVQVVWPCNVIPVGIVT
jgi:hypothetical protein